NLVGKISDDKIIQSINVKLAFAEFDLNNISGSEYYCNLVINNKTSNGEASGSVLNLLSIIEFQIKNNPEKALEFANQALKMYQSSQLKSRMAGMLVNIGNFYNILNNNIKAQENWNEALRLNSSIGNLEQESFIYNNLGVFYYRIGNYENAIEKWLIAINILRSIGLKNQLALTYLNMGEVYFRVCDYQKSFEYLLKAKDIFDRSDIIEEKIRSLVSLGKLWFILGDFEQLYKTMDKIEKLNKIASINPEQNYFNLNFLKFLLELNPVNTIKKNNKLEHFFEQAINGTQIEDKLEIIIIYSNYLLKTEQDTKLLNLFDSQILNELIKENIILMAYKYYFLGKINLLKPDNAEKSSIDYFEAAYNILEEHSISELTWKVLYEITLIYYERGNFFKLKKPRLYSYELLNMIGENISNNNLRSAYFNHPERKEALEKLLLIGNKTQVNEYQQSKH
ncbi:MAG: tetratricopeptide repeat protein, partial [Ignavibacteriaceae bacterium]|nr:tetratricopeptide repeat protein [Ignavibacteriaceae bacterium]